MPNIVGYRDGKKVLFSVVEKSYQIIKDENKGKIMIDIDDHYININEIDSLYLEKPQTLFTLVDYKGELIYEKEKLPVFVKGEIMTLE
jgi:hypothetical protein